MLEPKMLRECGLYLMSLARENTPEFYWLSGLAGTLTGYRIGTPLEKLFLRMDSKSVDKMLNRHSVVVQDTGMVLNHIQALSEIARIDVRMGNRIVCSGVAKRCGTSEAASLEQAVSQYLSRIVNILPLMQLPASDVVFGLLRGEPVVAESLAERQADANQLADSIRTLGTLGLGMYMEKANPKIAGIMKNGTDSVLSLYNLLAMLPTSASYGFGRMAESVRRNAAYLDGWKLENYCSELDRKNYIAEFRRRAGRLGISSNSRFANSFSDKYLGSIMSARQVLCHGDLHAGNIFADGRVLDPRLHIGAAGEDAAMLCVSSYAMHGTKGGYTALRILDEQGEFIQRYNRTRMEDGMDDPIRLARLDDTEMALARQAFERPLVPSTSVEGHMTRCLVMSAFTFACQNLKNYQQTCRSGYLNSARKAFGIFYSSIPAKMRREFDNAVNPDRISLLRIS